MKTIGFALIIALLAGTTVFASEMSVEEWLQYDQQASDMFHQVSEQVARGETPPIKCATPFFQSLQASMPADVYLKPLFPQREDTMSFTYASDHFFLHYTNTGNNTVYHYSEQNLVPGVPDYIVKSGQILDSVWNHTVGDLGFTAPLSDGYYNGGGNGLFDVYFINILAYGATVRDSIVTSSPTYTGTAYMFLENDYAGFYGYSDNPLEAIRVTAAHEFTHACQFAIDLQELEGPQSDPNPAWMEMSATSMEEEHYPDINDYINYLPYFYKVPSWSIRTGTMRSGSQVDPVSGRVDDWRNFHMYASAVFPIYLNEKFGADIIADIWNHCGDVAGPNWLSAMDDAIRQYSGNTMTLSDAYQEFATWNLFTSTKRARPGYFHDAILYDTVNLAARIGSYPATVNVVDSLLPDNLGADYIILDNLSAIISGLSVLFSPDKSQPWGLTIVEYDNNVMTPVSIRQIVYDSLNPMILIPDASDYDHIALIPEVIGGNAIKVDYSLTVTPLDSGVFRPDSGEVLYAGSTYQILWYDGGVSDSVEIELSRDNGATWQQIAITENDFSYDWTVPDLPSTECIIRVSEYPTGTPSFDSKGTFTIESTTSEGSVDVYPNPAWMQNYPEMFFRGRYKITQAVPVGEMSVTILTLAGEKVRELHQRDDQQAGVVVAAWDYKNESGKTVAAGPYLALFKFQGETTLKKFVVLR